SVSRGAINSWSLTKSDGASRHRVKWFSERADCDARLADENTLYRFSGGSTRLADGCERDGATGGVGGNSGIQSLFPSSGFGKGRTLDGVWFGIADFITASQLL